MIKKRMLSLLLALIMLVGLLPTTVFAAEGDHAHDDIIYNTAWSGSMSATTISKNTNIVLTDDVTFSGNLQISGGKTVNLCLNGKTLDMGSSVLKVFANGAIHICDCGEGGKITGSSYQGTISAWGTGAISISGGTISNDSNYTISNTDGSTTVTGGTIISFNTRYALYNSGSGKITVTGSAEVSGGMGIYNRNGEIEVSGGTVICNSTAIAQLGTGSITISGGTVSSTGTICIDNSDSGTVTVSGDAHISGTYGIQNRSGTVYINGGTVEGKTTWAIYNHGDNGVIEVSGGTITSASKEGIYNSKETGIIYLSGSPAISGNPAAISNGSGSVYAQSSDGSSVYTGGEVSICVRGASLNKVAVKKVTADNEEKFILANTPGGYLLKKDGENLVLGLPHTHSWSTAWSKDDTAHWHKCTAPDCTITENSQKAGYGEHSGTDDNNCTTAVICECGYVIKAAETAHDFSGAYSSDSINHWHKCKNCSVTDEKAAHTPKDDDGDCTTAILCSVCNYVTTAAQTEHDFTGNYLSDAEDHWHKCANCDVIDTKASHTPNDDDGDCLTAVLCSVCGYETTKGQIMHDFNNANLYDATGHWHKCSRCNETAAKYAHIEKITNESDGTHDKVCSDCAWVFAEDIGHNYAYTASGNVITETCGWTGCAHTATATLTAPENAVYDGTQKLATVTYSDGWAGEKLDVSYTGTANDGSSYDGIPNSVVKAGTVTASITKGSATASVTYTIGKATLTNVSVVQRGTLTYNGEEQMATVTASATAVNDQPVTFTYCATENGTYSKTIPAFTNAGTYTVYYKATASNHQEASGQFTVTIGKKPLTITAQDHTITYGDAPEAKDVTIEGFVDSETRNNLTGTLAYEYTYEQYDNVGSYAITPKGLTSNNYDITFKSGTLFVTPKTLGLTWTAPANLAYDGSAKVPGVAATDLAGGDTVNVTAALTNGADNVNVGSFTYTATGLSSDNYKLPDNPTSPSFTITKGTLTAEDFIYTAPADTRYTGEKITASVAMRADAKYDGIGEPILNYKLQGSGTVLDAMVDAGTYDVFVTVTGGKNWNDVTRLDLGVDVTIGSIIVTFDPNGGSGAMAPQVITTASAPLTANDFRRSGYVFNGWNTKPDGSGTAYADQADYAASNGSVTLYAQWRFNYLLLGSLGGLTGGADPCRGFVDVDRSQWYHQSVDYVLEEGLMNGISADRFGPHLTTTRGMIVTILYRLEGQPMVYGKAPFADVADGLWYTDAVTWANAFGIVEGYSETAFGPNDPITREQLAAILWRYAKYQGYDVSVGEDTNILSYNDAFDVSQYAIPAMQWACGAGIINGSNGCLMPGGNATRCQAAAILHRFCEVTGG